MLLSMVNGMWTEVKDAIFWPGHEMPHSPPHFLIACQPAECRESNKNSKEASEYCGATIEVHSKVTWVTAYIRISLLWHAPLHPQWLLAALQEQEITFIILNNPELESVMVASFKCPDWYRAPVQSSLYTGGKKITQHAQEHKKDGRHGIEAEKVHIQSMASSDLTQFSSSPVGFAMFPAHHAHATTLLLVRPFLLEFPSLSVSFKYLHNFLKVQYKSHLTDWTSIISSYCNLMWQK